MSRGEYVFESLHADFELKLPALSADLQIVFRDETKPAALWIPPPPRFFFWIVWKRIINDINGFKHRPRHQLNYNRRYESDRWRRQG